LRARWRESNDEYDLAFADYEQMHKLLAEQVEPLSNMARVAVRAGKGKESEDRYRALVEIVSPREPRSDESLPTDGMSVEELMLRGGYAANLEKRDLELKFLNAAVAMQRGHVRALELIASLTRSVQVVSWLITLNQSRADYFVMRTEFMMPRPLMGDLDSAVRLEPFEAKHYAQRAQWEQGQAAIADYRRAIDLEPGNPVYCYGLSRAYAAQHAFLLQTLALNWALVGDPENAEWLKERAALP
jgi:tetratricopeptide (TPR) repeat protein